MLIGMEFLRSSFGTDRRRVGLRSLLGDKRAVSAIEFSIWAPIMCLGVFVGIDITRYAIATGRISDVASTMGQMLSVNLAGTVNYVDLQFYHDSAMIIYPQVLADAAQKGIPWSNDLNITMSGIDFNPSPPNCGNNCQYIPKVSWSSGSNRRSCLIPAIAASDTATPSATTLPSDVFGPTSILVVDVTYTFRPMIAGRLFGNINIKRSFYTTPRYVSSIGYSVITGDPGTTTVCM